MEVYVAKDIFVHVFYGGKPQTFRASEYPYDIGQNSDSGNVVVTESVLGVERGTLSNFVVDKAE